MTLQEFGPIVSAAVAVIALVIGLILVPRVQNLITEKIETFEAHFMDLETKAHGAIIEAIHEIREEQKVHRANPNAHPNLLTVSRLEPKMEDVRVELVKLQVVVDTLRTAWATEPAPRRRPARA